MTSKLLKKILLAFIFLLIVINVNSQNMDYKATWKKVDALVDNYPQQAQKLIDSIYQIAKKQNNGDQILKCYIYYFKSNRYQEDYFETEVAKMEADLKNAPIADKSMMYSILGDLYWQYYLSNSWKIINRTEIIKFLPDDIKTWTAENFAQKSILYYNKSIENETELKKIPADFYKEMILAGTKPLELRPTLYDFLAARAVQFYSGSEATITRPLDYFQVLDEKYFADVQTFVDNNFNSIDTLSLHFNGIKILQNWLKFRLADSKNIEALISTDMVRLQFVYNLSVNSQKEQLYLQALENIVQKYPNAIQTGFVELAIAGIYVSQAAQYNADDSSTFAYKNYYLKAHKLYEDIISQYKKYDEISKTAQNGIYSIESHALSFSTEEIITEKTPVALKLNYKNFKKVYIEVRAVKYGELKDYLENGVNWDKFRRTRYELLKTYSFDLKETENYQGHSTEILLDGLPNGDYLIAVSSGPNFDTECVNNYQFLQVSNISVIHQTAKFGVEECYVLNRLTSKPIENAQVKAYYKDYNYTLRKYVTKIFGTYTTDKNGYFKMNPDVDYRYLNFEITSGDDILLSMNEANLYKTYEETSTKTSIYFFTDRKLYRPGQTVFFKGIAVVADSSSRTIVPKLSTDVIFYDVNWQEISRVKVTTNDFGTFNGSFQIPTGLLNGAMTISAGSYGSIGIQVEEYKRPAFFVEMLPIDKQYLVNDVVNVKGKAENYAGVKLNDATVSYKVMRTSVWRGWWWWNIRTNEILVTRGVAKTDENGIFSIDFKAVPDLQMPTNSNTAFNYEVTVDITDINGETHSTSSVVQVGYTALNVTTNISDKISVNDFKKDYKSITVIAKNLNGQDVPADGTLELYSLKEPQTPIRKRYWTKPDVYSYSQDEWYKLYPNNEYKNESDIKYWDTDKKVWSNTFSTSKTKDVDISGMSKIEPGVYKLVIKSKDEFGNPIENAQFVTIYDENSNKMPYNTYTWFVQMDNNLEPGQNARFLIGSSDNVTAIYQVVRGNQILKRELITLNNNQKLLEVPVTEDLRGGFGVSVVFVVNNRVYTNSANVYVPYTNKELKFEFATFRDKLLPGQQETWKLIIKDTLKDPQIAELLTTLYDASLDDLMPNSWAFSIYPYFYNSLYWNYGTFNVNSSVVINNLTPRYEHVPSTYFSQLNWFNYYYNYYNYDEIDEVKVTALGVKREEKSKDDIAVVPSSYASQSPVGGNDKSILALDGNATNSPVTETGALKQGEQNQNKEVQIRQNLNETAFFFPELHTNEKGELTISFTMPEALTKWRFLGLATTKDLKFGMFDKYVITQKQLMVMPNAPRFLRQGDTLLFSTKVANLSDKDLTGTVSLEFLDELNGTTVNILAKGETMNKPFTVKKDQSTMVNWQIVVPFDAEILTYRVIAKAGDFSDGEQKPLPVLSNRMLVLESMPLPIRANQTKTFKFDKLIHSGDSKTLKSERFTIEFTSNPAWLAIQALPYILEYPYECSEQTFARYYANSIASYIANSSPKIKAVFDTWKNYQPNALLSNLEKNQDLKQAILEETPWVLDAKDETERKQRVALLFDLNRMSYELSEAFDKLDKAQTVNGGWPWFKGMPESWYISQYIIEGFGHLYKLNVIDSTDNKIKRMTEKGLSFCDGEMQDYYNELKKYFTQDDWEKYMPSSIIVHNFYTRSFFLNNKLPQRYQKESDYFYGQMKKYWGKYDIYSQAMMALIFSRNGDSKLALDIIKSLKEKAVMNEELGMYWKENAEGYYWYQAPIETQSVMIEAFYEVAKDNNSVDEMKIWLLKNKQTNDWKTTTATAQAIYALLITGGKDLLANNQISPITIGSITIDPQKDKTIQTEAGTGYYKVSFTGNDIKPDMGNITVQNKNNIVAWGAAYWQYWEDLDKITPHETPLKMKKDLYIEVTSDRGTQLQPITENTPIKVGDKIIVRIELRVDRDMEYVHMKDMRASGFEPIDVISGYHWQDGLGYYQTTKDASTNFFFDVLRKGTYVFQYALRANIAGNFSNGISSIQCMYAPEFTSHSQGIRVKINN